MRVGARKVLRLVDDRCGVVGTVVIARRERSYLVTGSGASRALPDVPSIRICRMVRDAQGQSFGAASADGTGTIVPSMTRLGLHTIATFVWVLVLGLTSLALVPSVVGYRPVLVTSGSMSPSINLGDVVVTAPTDGENLAVGVVVDHNADGGRRIHRVVEATPSGYRTKGDANLTADSEVVSPNKVKGIGALVVPFVGLPGAWLDRGDWLTLLVVVSALIATAWMARPRWAFPDSGAVRCDD